MHLYWFYLIYQMAKALLLESNSERDVHSEPEYSPQTFEDNGTDDSQEVSRESSQQSVSQFQYDADPGPSYMHRRIVY